MRIDAIGYQPYVYRVNRLGSASLSRVNAIGSDLLMSKTDFSGLTGGGGSSPNPLRRGETASFAEVLAMQMQMGRRNADRLLAPPDAETGYDLPKAGQQPEASLYRLRHAAESYSTAMAM